MLLHGMPFLLLSTLGVLLWSCMPSPLMGQWQWAREQWLQSVWQERNLEAQGEFTAYF